MLNLLRLDDDDGGRASAEAFAQRIGPLPENLGAG